MIATACRPHDVVEVEWIDSFSSAPWGTRDEHVKAAAEFDQSMHRSVGYVLVVSDRSLTVVQSWMDDVGQGEMCGDSMCIPRCAISKVTMIRRHDR